MKRKMLWLLFIPLLSGCLNYFSVPPVEETKEQTEMEIPAVEIPPIIEDEIEIVEHATLFDFEIEESVITEYTRVDLTDEEIKARERLGLTEDLIDGLKKNQTGRYHFDRLNSDEQKLYVELLVIMEEYGSDIVISSLSPESIEKVFQCVLNDHPGIFYVVGYRYNKFSLEDVTKKITFTATYSIGTIEKNNRQQKIDAYVDKCLAGVPQGADEYTKVKYVYEYLIHNTDYDAMAPDNQNICSVFLRGRSVCQGYAKATQYLLNALGIPTTIIMGKVIGGEGHAWNISLIDGDYYHIDTTFGDASYQIEGSNDATANSWSNNIWPINYDYFCVTTEQIGKTHMIEPIVTLVECKATRNNYFVREGLFFTTVDEDKLRALFNREYERGSMYVTIKCANIQVYKEMMDFLIEQQNIFNYLNDNDGVIRYADMENQLSISFWL
ncbi:MAG: hypothetical protein FWC09_03825 [Lachnospiraceae bacterium]|nr:hypothetical protein [Lachnospiraceae bacterium]